MTTLFGLITCLMLSLAAWTGWSVFVVFAALFGGATAASFVAWLFRRRDREPRGAHSVR